LKYNFERNWIGKLPKPEMELGGICVVEKRHGFYCAVLRLMNETKAVATRNEERIKERNE
jgi:hypothetical protein